MASVIGLTNEASESGKAFAENIQTAGTELASMQAGFGVHTLFRPSVVDTETGKHGIRWQIAKVLRQNQAVLPVAPVSDQSPFPFRNVYIAYGMTTSAIIAECRKVTGFDKYPDKTFSDVLGTEMGTISKHVASIRMTSAEDSERECKAPRNVWYLTPEGLEALEWEENKA